MLFSLFEQSDIIEEVSFRFRTKVLRKNIKKQRSVYAGRAAARLAAKANPSLAKRKAMFRKKYLELKEREQRVYGRRGLALARQH